MKKTIVYVIASIFLVLLVVSNPSSCEEEKIINSINNPKGIGLNVFIKLDEDKEFVYELAKYLQDVAYAELKNKLPSTVQIQKEYVNNPLLSDKENYDRDMDYFIQLCANRKWIHKDIFINIDVLMGAMDRDYYYGGIRLTKSFFAFSEDSLVNLFNKLNAVKQDNYNEKEINEIYWDIRSTFDRSKTEVEIILQEYIFVNFKKIDIRGYLSDKTEEMIMSFVNDYYENQERIENLND